MKQLVIIILISLLSTHLWAQDELPLVKAAQEHYAEGAYEDALSSYEQLLGQGYISAKLYYNLGNVHFKLNNVASAILYYEKAKKLSPDDSDVNFNLVIANQRIVDKLDKVPESILTSTYKSYRSMMDTDQWAKTAVVLFVFSLTCILIYLTGRHAPLRRVAFLLGVISFLLFIQSYLMAQQNFETMQSEDYAITFQSTINVKSEPKDDSTDLFVIHEGLKVQILENRLGWYKIKLVNGSIGWLSESAIQII